MRASVTSFTKKFISTFFAATLALGLVPVAAFAANDENSESANADRIETTNDATSSEVGEASNPLVISSGEAEGLGDEKSALIEQNGDEVATTSRGEDEAADDAAGGDASISIPAVTQRVNEDVALTSRTVAQAESTRSYFLAQTLESTRTVPIVSANLPLDMGAVTESDVPVGDDGTSEDEGGEDSDESDLTSGVIAAESTVVGSFAYLGITYAVEPGGESVAVVAADYGKLPEEFIEAQVIVLPSMVTPDGLDYYGVTRIADNAFSTVTSQEDEEDITAITIPASVTEIGEDAFTSFDTLQYVIVSEDNPNYGMYDGCLYDAELNRLLLIPEGRSGAVRVAPNATEFSSGVFSHCPSVDALVADPDSAAYAALIERGEANSSDTDNAKKMVISASDVVSGLVSVEFADEESIQYVRDFASHYDFDSASGVHKFSLETRDIAYQSSGFLTDYSAFESFTLHLPPNDDRFYVYWGGTHGDSGLGVRGLYGGTWEQLHSGGDGVVNRMSDEVTAMRVFYPSGLELNSNRLVDSFCWFDAKVNQWRRICYNKTNAKLWVTFSNTADRQGGFTIPADIPLHNTGENVQPGQHLHVWVDYNLQVTWDPQEGWWQEGNRRYDHGNQKYVEAATAADGSSTLSGFDHPTSVVSLDPSKVFYGWNENKNATKDSTSGWWYTVDDRYYPITSTNQPKTLYAIYADAYAMTWDVETLGSTKASVVDCTPDVIANSKNSVANTVGKTKDKTESVVIDRPENGTGTMVFPDSTYNGSSAPKGMAFLGWTNQSDGSAPRDSSGRSHEYFEPGSTYVVSAGGITASDDSQDTFALNCYETTHWYAAWWVDIEFAATNYGGKIAGDTNDRITATVPNNRPVSQDLIPNVWQPGEKDWLGESGWFVPKTQGQAGFAIDKWDYKGWTSQANPNASAGEGGSTTFGGSIAHLDESMLLTGEFTETDESQALVPNGPTTFYPVWECKVSWVADESRPAGADINPQESAWYLYGYQLPAPGVRDTPDSHHFAAWRDTAGNSVSEATGTYTVLTGGPVTAYWAPNERDVLLNGNSADTADAQRVWAEYDATMPTTLSGGGFVQLPTRQGYVFAGYWNTRYTEAEGVEEVVPTTRLKEGSTTDYETVTVKAKRYYGVNDAQNPTSFANVETWDIANDSQQLFAHWKYRIVLDANVAADAADKVKLQHMGDGIAGTPSGSSLTDGAYGNVYRYTDDTRSYIAQAEEIAIDAVAGAPLKLPYAIGRPGYESTVAWKANGSIVPVTDEGWTIAAFPEAGETAHKASPVLGSAKPDATTRILRLTADWSGDYADQGLGGSPKTYTVKLAAAYPVAEGEEAFTVKDADKGTTEIANVRYDAPLSNAMATIDAPFRDGYTFMGYSTEKNPDSASPSGTLYIQGVANKTSADKATVTSSLWKEAPSGTDEVTLYAAWKKDVYNVVFAPTVLSGAGADEDLTPGTEPVTASAIEGRTWGYGERMNQSTFPVASKLLESPSPFFRNGYDFCGWYYFDEDGEPVKVSSGAGTPGQTESGLDATWKPRKAWQVAHRNDAGASITLYAAWTPKVYELRFDLARPGETDAAIPSATYPAAGNRENVKQAADGTWYYEVRYGDEIAPYFGEAGDAASVPEFEPYAFLGWIHDDEHLFAGDDAGAKGIYAPSYDIARWSEGVNVVTYTGDWDPPSPSTVTFHSDSHGKFDDGAREIVVEGFEYSPDAVEIGSDKRPTDVDAGYLFEGYVAGPANGERPSDLYMDGKRNEAYPLVFALSRIKDDTHLWAVYSKEPMSVTLEVPEGALAYESEDADAKRAAVVYPFDVEDDPFMLPSDVRQPGKRFVGWKLKGSTDDPSKTVTIAPSSIAGGTATSWTYVPVLEDRVYRVSFDPNYKTAASQSAGETRYVYLTYDGKVVDPGTVDGAEKDAVFGEMPMTPEPKAQSADGRTYRSYAFTSWWVGTDDSMRRPERKRAGESIAENEWHAVFDNAAFTKAIAATDMTEADEKAKATDALTVYAEWDPAVSAICPLYVPLALDSQTGDVAIPDEDFGIASSTGAALEVAALRYDRIDAVESNGTKTSPFARASSDETPVYLNVFAGVATEGLDMGRASIEDGTVTGAYGKTETTAPLRIDLSAPSAIYTPYDHALFAAFDTDDASKKNRGALKVRYGLDLDGVSTTTLARIRTLMPSQNGKLQANGWTAEQVPVARLLYTVQLAETN